MIRSEQHAELGILSDDANRLFKQWEARGGPRGEQAFTLIAIVEYVCGAAWV